MKAVTTITSCRACGNSKIKPFFNLGKQPLANSLIGTQTAKEHAYNLSLSFCPRCSLAQLNETINPERLFLEYPWVTGTSRGAREFAPVFAREVLRRVEEKAPFVVEIASNDGTFLLPFCEKKVRAIGVDPAKNVVAIAREKGVPTIADFFSEKVARSIVSDHGAADIVIARNVLYHVADLAGVMKGIARVLKSQGVLVAEFHYGAKIQRELHYDAIYHEHIAYYTLKSFELLLKRYGLFGFDVGESPINSGGLIVYASPLRRPKTVNYKALERDEREGKVNTLAQWKVFASSSEKHRTAFRDRVAEIVAQGGRIVGYGASARSSTLLNYCGITHDVIEEIADGNPLKQGKYTAGSRIPIRAPEKVFKKNPDLVVLLAWNFKNEIMSIARKEYGYKGPFLVPLPFTAKVTRARI